jgi:hypothetical protein
MILIRWSELGTVNEAGDYSLADGSVVTVTDEYIQTAREIFQEGTDPMISLLPTSEEPQTPKRYRLGRFE